MADYINDNPKTTRIDKPVESLIQYQGRNTVLDITIDEQTPLMEVYRDQKNHVTLKPLNDNTKENKIEIIGENSDLLEITHGENGTDETTKLEPISDIRKENTIEPVASSAGNILSSIEHGTNRTNETSKLKIENDNTKEQVLEAKESVTGNNLIGLEKGENGTSNTTKIFGINDNTKEQVLEVSGTEQEKKLITLEKGTNGTNETTKITVHSDDSKENKLTFQTGTPDTVGITRVGNTININVNNSGGEPTHLNFSTDTPDLLDVSRDNENIKINAFHDSTKQNIFTASTETSNLIEVKQESDKLIINGKSDSTKENILNFNTQTPNNISVTKQNDEVTINFLGGSTSEKTFESTDTNLLTISDSENKVSFTPKHDNTKENILTFNTNTPSNINITKQNDTVTINYIEGEQAVQYIVGFRILNKSQVILTISNDVRTVFKVSYKDSGEEQIIEGAYIDTEKHNLTEYDIRPSDDIISEIIIKDNLDNILYYYDLTFLNPESKIYQSTDTSLLEISSTDSNVTFTPKHDSTKEDKLTFTTADETMLSIERMDNEIMFIPEHDTTKQDVLNFTTNTPNTVTVSKANNTVTIDVTESESTNILFSVKECNIETNQIVLYMNSHNTDNIFVSYYHDDESTGTIVKPTSFNIGTTYEIANPFDNKKNKVIVTQNSAGSNPIFYFDFTYMDYIKPNIVTYNNFNPAPSKNIMNQQIVFTEKGDYSNINVRVVSNTASLLGTVNYNYTTNTTIWTVPDELTDISHVEFIITSTNEIIKKVPITIEKQLYGLGGLNMYNVGDIYISTVMINPAELYGGVWGFVGQGKTLVGVDYNDADFSSAEKTGGQKTQKFKYGIIYSPYFGTNTGSDEGLIRTSVYNGTTDTGNFRNSTLFKEEQTIANVSIGDSNKSITSSSHKNTGETSEENIMNPYYTVYIWKRIS